MLGAGVAPMGPWAARPRDVEIHRRRLGCSQTDFALQAIAECRAHYNDRRVWGWRPGQAVVVTRAAAT